MSEDVFPEDLAIRVRNIGKTYRLGVISRRTLRDEFAYRWLRMRGRDPKDSMGRVGGRELEDPGLFHALDDVSFDIRKGETVGLIGRNGAGKSTMLKILARITTPSSGEAWIRGRVGSMLEVGTGFHPELTGRENIYLNGTILGMPKKEIDAKFDEIVAFSEIGEFLDTPVKRYSSGMYVKLAFSIASSLDNDVLLLDEVLAVGDAAFRKKSLDRMREIAASGRTILFVSHSETNIRNICSRCLWFEEGRVKMDGPTDDVLSAYIADSESGTEAPGAELRTEAELSPDLHLHWGQFSAELELVRVSLLNESPVIASNEPIDVSIVVRNNGSTRRDCQFTVYVQDEKDQRVEGFYTDPVPVPAGRETYEARLKLKGHGLYQGFYGLRFTVGMRDYASGVRTFDATKSVLSFEVRYVDRRKKNLFAVRSDWFKSIYRTGEDIEVSLC